MFTNIVSNSNWYGRFVNQHKTDEPNLILLCILLDFAFTLVNVIDFNFCNNASTAGTKSRNQRLFRDFD
jgi:hypothetical protein